MRDLSMMPSLSLAAHLELERHRVQARRREQAQAKRLASALDVEGQEWDLQKKLMAAEDATVQGVVVRGNPPSSAWNRVKARLGMGAGARLGFSSRSMDFAGLVALVKAQLARFRFEDGPIQRVRLSPARRRSRVTAKDPTAAPMPRAE